MSSPQPFGSRCTAATLLFLYPELQSHTNSRNSSYIETFKVRGDEPGSIVTFSTKVIVYFHNFNNASFGKTTEFSHFHRTYNEKMTEIRFT